ncbi:MAG: hypothetical protein IPO63_15650 [Bacteroidetes bacterium]|nr:hypothetical protein [Bacteroidota bacterium]
MKTMKKIFLLCLFLSLTYSNTFAQVEGEPTPSTLSNEPQTTYASLLSRLVVNLSKDAYTDKFHPIISKWNPANSTKAQALDVLKNLEFHLKTLHFKPTWKDVQLAWRGKFSKTTEKTDIVLLLKELEANLQLSAFEKTWSEDRKAWLLDVNSYLKK